MGRISKKKRHIIETAAALFTKFGIRRVTVEEICREAGASKMTFYKYFPNKIELLKTIWSGWIDDAYRRLDELDAMDIPFAEKMLLIVEYKMELLSNIGPEMLEEVLHADPEIKDFVTDMRHRSLSRFMKFVADAQARGDMRRIRPEFVLAMMDKLQEVAGNYELRNLYASDLEFVREVNDFFFFGIMPVQRETGDAR
jgi:AcrR family transcriptional regulator